MRAYALIKRNARPIIIRFARDNCMEIVCVRARVCVLSHIACKLVGKHCASTRQTMGLTVNIYTFFCVFIETSIIDSLQRSLVGWEGVRVCVCVWLDRNPKSYVFVNPPEYWLPNLGIPSNHPSILVMRFDRLLTTIIE